MAIIKASTSVLGPATVAGGATTDLADCITTDLTKATQLVIVFKGEFHNSATNGARVTFYPSYDGTNFDSQPWENMEGTPLEWDIECKAGEAVIRTTEAISPAPKYLKEQVENLDATYAIANCQIIVTAQTAG